MDTPCKPDKTPLGEAPGATMPHVIVQLARTRLANGWCMSQQRTHMNDTTPSKVVRRAALAGETHVLGSPPPAFLHDDPAPGANRLYGGIDPMGTDAAYVAGRFVWPHGTTCALLGAGFLDDVLSAVYEVRTVEKTTLVCHVYDAPCADLEVALYDTTRQPTELERRWLGGHATTTAIFALRCLVGRTVKRTPLDRLPAHLIDGEYHLLRRGPFPFLRLRSARTAREYAMGGALVTGLLRAVPTPIFHAFDATQTHAPDRELLTVFDRAPAPCAQPAAGDDSDLRQLAGGMLAMASCAHALLAVVPIHNDDDDTTVEAANAKSPSIHVRYNDDPSLTSATTTTPLVRLLRGTPLKPMVDGSSAPSNVYGLAEAIFAPEDVLIAVHCASAAAPASVQMWDVVLPLARTVDTSSGVVLLRVDNLGCVLSGSLVNATICASALCFDALCRLVHLPCIATIVAEGDSICVAQAGALATGATPLLPVADVLRRAFAAARSMSAIP